MIGVISLASLLALSSSLELRQVFENWANQFRVEFQNEIHKQGTFIKWIENHAYIERINSQNKTYTLGHNQFSGMNSDDFSKYLASSYARFNAVRAYRGEHYTPNDVNLAASIDWVAKGAVTPVKDQGQCGSCWSFSTTGALEGAYFLKYGRLVSFSEQQLVDCDSLGNGGRDHGCNGGLMDNAFDWISKNGGLCTESSYPYVSGNTKTAGSCQHTCPIVSGSSISRHVDVSKTDNSLMSALTQQPVSVAIEADQRDFQLYKSGVFTGTCGTNLDHGVLVVGYGSEGGLDFYKIKNSWSSSWGENGYIRIGRGAQYNGGAGQCGVLLQASYPLL